MNKRIGIILMSIIILTNFVGCSSLPQNAANNNPPEQVEKSNGEKAESQDQPAKLSLYVHSRDIQAQSFSKSYIEEVTNTILDVTQVTAGELENKLNVILASKDRPDIISFHTDAMEAKLAQGKVLIPLNKYFGKYPALKASRSEEVWESMRHPDGNIYSIGYDTANPLSIIGYRKDWLDAMGKEVPTTLDEYYEVAKAMALNDPNRSGVNDTYAFGGYGSVDVFMDHIFGAYGSLPNYWMIQDGEIVSGTIQPGMKDALRFLKKLYDEKIIDPEFATDSSDRWKMKVKSGIFGAGETKVHLFDKNNLQNYYAPFIEANPAGEIVYGPPLKGGSSNPLGVRMASKKGWVRTGISADSEDIDAALRLLTWAASDEGNLFINYGIEGEDYKVDNGLVVKLRSDSELGSRDIDKFYIAKKTLFDHSSPGLHEAFVYTAKTAQHNPVDGLMVPEAIKYEADLIDFTNDEYMKMIVGAVDIETGFEAFVSQWKNRGGDALAQAYREAYKAK